MNFSFDVAGGASSHEKAPTPERSSVNVMLHVTVWDDDVVSIVEGPTLNPVSTGAVVSQAANRGLEAKPASAANTTPTAIRRDTMRSSGEYAQVSVDRSATTRDLIVPGARHSGWRDVRGDGRGV
jgi:hypothetical protein